MPAGTAPDKVLTAVQGFCREEFGLKHRYVAALHTDEPHPHVHVMRRHDGAERLVPLHRGSAGCSRNGILGSRTPIMHTPEQ